MSEVPDRSPWWLWPHLLALDAPAVAVLWQRFLAALFGLPLSADHSVCLGLVVWGVYLLDRGLDARPGRPPDTADRHRFARRHWGRFLGFGIATLVTGFGVAVTRLPLSTLRDGAVVGALLAGYLAVVHLALDAASGAKEMAVGVLFAAGVGVPLAGRAPERAAEWGPAVVGFAAVCWLNCRLIDRWERGRPGFGRGPTAAVTLAGGAALWSPPAAGGAVAAAVVGLAGLHLVRDRLGGRATRVLADVVLLTPLLGGWPS